MANLTMFYGVQLYGEFDRWRDFWNSDINSEVYNGAYVYSPYTAKVDRIDCPWYRSDCTPVLLEDVPKELRAYVLILNL